MLTKLVRELSPRIWITIRAYASDDDHADDLLQDCWLRILEELDNYRRGGSFASWAVAVSRNLCSSKLRGRPHDDPAEVPLSHVRQMPDGTSELPSPEAAARQQYWRQVVHDALERLPGRERDVIVLRLLEGRDTAETAEALGISESGVRSILLRGMTRLRRMKRLREVLPEWIGAN